MSGYAYGIVSVEDYIDCGLRLRLSAARTLTLYREMGGSIRTREFYDRWHSRKGVNPPKLSEKLALSEDA